MLWYVFRRLEVPGQGEVFKAVSPFPTEAETAQQALLDRAAAKGLEEGAYLVLGADREKNLYTLDSTKKYEVS